ncbi:SH2 domain-containing protein 3C-like isoform X2 [Lates japonicus]|uniref:SH2 domain-containing protein 3C-like isoform X2 n=1 Tax=Lates japonicus TaxID=270547 RepID=A0AAD3MWA6_LATJO|nr:SH2 domain-containing protein 3C-like isoform X2 [Lates japonicus]
MRSASRPARCGSVSQLLRTQLQSVCRTERDEMSEVVDSECRSVSSGEAERRCEEAVCVLIISQLKCPLTWLYQIVEVVW